MTVVLDGLTWEHPRAWRGLEAACASVPEVTVKWHRQSLAGFENEPVAQLAQRFDLLVVDHPGLGAAIAGDALVPLAQVLEAVDLAAWQSESVAATWSSYTVDDVLWALPLDAATQATVYRADLLADPPRRWDDVADLARSRPVALCLGGPHAGLLLLAMSAERRPGRPSLFDAELTAAAVDLLRALWRSVDREASRLDPIGLHDMLATTDEVVCCLLTYTYAVYGSAGTGQPLSWAPAPTFVAARPEAASVLGGTGLAVSARALDRPDALRLVIRRLMDPRVQLDVVAPLGGQPAVRSVWDSEAADRAVNGHYSRTRESLDGAYVRPRQDGWIAFQDELSHRVREALTTSTPSEKVAADLELAYARSLAVTAQEVR
jgi:multiple sugar transport system substrate-binding protein